MTANDPARAPRPETKGDEHMTTNPFPPESDELADIALSAMPIATPVDQISAHAQWWSTVRRTAPLAPPWLSTLITEILVSDLASDGLLIVAEALDDAALAAGVDGKVSLAMQLQDLANLPRELAPRRVKRDV